MSTPSGPAASGSTPQPGRSGEAGHGDSADEASGAGARASETTTVVDTEVGDGEGDRKRTPVGLIRRSGTAALGWFLPEIPRPRVAILRAAIYLFVIYDTLYFVNDVIPHGHAPELYQPLWIGRVLPLPEPSVGLAWTLQILIIVGALVAASGRLPRLAGWIVAVCYFEWLIIGMSYGKVDHDHFALLIAVFVLPTIGRARIRDAGTTQAAGWAFRCIQISVIFTYFGAALAKWVRNGAPLTWANSAVLTWAFIRRGTALARWSLDYRWILRTGQWIMLIAEYLSPVVLFLKGRWLYLAASFFLTFHLVTFMTLGIHFLPTVICWLAFFPTEKLLPRRLRPAGPQPEGEAAVQGR